MPNDDPTSRTDQSMRLTGGLIDRSKTLRFTFNGRAMVGHPGDTLASALLANGQRLVGRSFKYHRPRGIFSAGSEEPNALLQLRRDASQEPNTKATTIELFDGLQATSQNHRGSLNFDLMAINDHVAPFLSAGFYYKTFMWPKLFWEKVYEPIIRSAAGLGRLSVEPDPDSYDKGFLHCDVLVVGAGPAGLSAALAAGRSGARVILADEDFAAGGRLLAERYQVDGGAGAAWAGDVAGELADMKNVRVMVRTTVYGAYDHGIYGALERKTDHLATSAGKPRQVLWRIYSKRAILCAGALERSIAFGNNDRPGVMLAGAVRAYLNRWGVAPGQSVAVLTNNDDGYRTAADLKAAGVPVPAIIDTRPDPVIETPSDIKRIVNDCVVDTSGRLQLKDLILSSGRRISVDCLAVSGGWNPNVQLTCHQRGHPIWNQDMAAFVPGPDLPIGMSVAGSARGTMTLGRVLGEGHAKGAAAAAELGYNRPAGGSAQSADEPSDISAFWYIGAGKARAFVDLQNDVTTKDIKQSHQEGFRSVEHLKRYTTLGMATDQGKTANILGLAVLAEVSGKTIPETGTTIFRPPYSPVAIGAFGGRSRGKNFRPTRLTPSHQWASAQGAVFVEAGAWLRAQWFARSCETHWRESVDREVKQTRNSVGVCDVTTLGKIDIQGRDAGTFLDKVYANTFSTLPVGRVRYGLMLREDGIVMDDGTTARLDQNHFLMTTTTANAVGVFRHLEFCRQCLSPGLDVHLMSVTEQWAQFSVAGRNARRLLERVVDDGTDLSNEAFPFMACRDIKICGGVRARFFRISFSGELAYEIAVPARYGNAMMEVLMQAGEPFDVVAYGTEALGVMRIEKGHAAGNELNGQTTARDLGLDRMVSAKKDCIGKVLSQRPELNREDGYRLMGFIPVDKGNHLRSGAHFVAKGDEATTRNDQGYMTSVAFSPMLGHSIGLGFIKRGGEREGEVVQAANPLAGETIDVKIVSPHFYDPQGVRLRD